jgi:hypothetical protein
MLTNLTVNDLAIIISKMITGKADFGLLMNQIGFPITILFKIPSPKGII